MFQGLKAGKLERSSRTGAKILIRPVYSRIQPRLPQGLDWD